MTDRKQHDRPIEEIQAGDEFRQKMISRADSDVFGGAPLWHGWVIMEAFLAGIDYARATEAATAQETPGAISGPKDG